MTCLDLEWGRTMGLLMFGGVVLPRFPPVFLGIAVLVTAATGTVAEEPQPNSSPTLQRSAGSSPPAPPASLQALLSLSDPESPSIGAHLAKQHYAANQETTSYLQRPTSVAEMVAGPIAPPPAAAAGWTDWTTSQLQNQFRASVGPLASFKSTQQHRVPAQKETFSKNQEGGSDPTLAMTLKPSQPLESPKLDLLDFPADQPSQDTSSTRQLSSSSAALLEKVDEERSEDVLQKPNEMLSPSYNVPFFSPHPTSAFPGPTDVPENLYSTNSVDFDWGSGDYLETMSLDSGRDDPPLATQVPPDAFDLDDYTETYDTSFPSRVGVPLSSMFHDLPTASLRPPDGAVPPTASSFPSSHLRSVDFRLDPTPTASADTPDVSDVDWSDIFSIHPTAVLLPDMNSLEYYSDQLSKDNGSEHRGDVPSEATPPVLGQDSVLSEDDVLGDSSGFEPREESTPVQTTEEAPDSWSDFESFHNPSVAPTHGLRSSSSFEGGRTSLSDWSSVGTNALQQTATSWTSSLTDVHWFVTESSIQATSVLAPTAPFTHILSEPAVTGGTTSNDDVTSAESTFSNVTSAPPFVLSDQEVTEGGVGMETTATLILSSPKHHPPTRTTEASTSLNVVSKTTAASREFLCNVTGSAYLTKVGFPSGTSVGHAKAQIRDILKRAFNKSLELQVVHPPPKLVFRVVSGRIVYTAIAVVNALRRSNPGRRFLSVSINWTVPGYQYQVHTVLQFVPGHVDVRFCSFSENIEKGLTLALAELRRRSKQSSDFTVQIVNITMAAVHDEEQQPVDITFTVRGSRGYLAGSEVSTALIKLSVVEFSFYMGFPVQQIAEPFHYPMLNTSHVLRSSWVRTVLLGVLDHKVGERTFQANIERRVAMLLGEALGSVRRVKRATIIGNNSVQVVSSTRLDGTEKPLELIYFVEGPEGERVPAVQTANLLNSLDVQRAAIVLGYRVLGPLAQPVEKVAPPPSDTANTNVWIVLGVVIPLLVVIVIISILYWKLCRTDKLEFQADAVTAIQQRQKSTTALGEAETWLHKPFPAASKRDHEFSEEEEVEYEEEEEEEEEEQEEEEDEEEEEQEEEEKPLVLHKSRGSGSYLEEEEEETDEDQEEKEKAEQEGVHEERSIQEREDEKETPERRTRKERVFPKEELQTPSVKGFDFAKLHLGQPSKDDVTVIQEPDPGPLPLPVVKDGFSPSENGAIPAPLPKASVSSSKGSRSSRRRERVSPSDGDSAVSDHSSEWESTEKNLRGHAAPGDRKPPRKVPINVLNGKNRIAPPPAAAPPPPLKMMMNGTNEPLSSASIFDHVDRMSRSTDVSRRPPNKVQLIAMQPMPAPPLHSPPTNDKLADTNHIKEVSLRNKSEVEHHRNRIRLRAKRKGHYDFPAMEDVSAGPREERDPHHASQQPPKSVDSDAHTSCVYFESKKSGRGRRSPKQKGKEPPNGGLKDADKDQLISEDGVHRKCPGFNNVAFVSDPDQGRGSPSPADDVFLGPASSPPGPAPPPPPYAPPQPSIEEARQQMHSLLDDAFALVSPTSQGSTAGMTLPGVGSPPSRGPRPWAPSFQALSPLPSRFSELSVSSPAVQGLNPRLVSSYAPTGHREHLHPDSLFSSRALHAEELNSSARPRPVGGTAGVQLRHLTQVGLSSRLNGVPVGSHSAAGLNGGWNHYQENKSREQFLDFPDYSSPSFFQMYRNASREPVAPPSHLDTPGLGYETTAAPLESSPPTPSSASLIKAIREELLRLSQKQAALPTYHS